MEITKENVDLNLVDLERAAIYLMCNSDSDESDLEDQMANLCVSLKNNKKTKSNAMPTDLLVAAKAARMSSSSESELDSDDASSTEESD